MDEKTIKFLDEHAAKALEGSIEHWEQNLQCIPDISTGPYQCPLCVLFNIHKPPVERCRGCPVFEKTKQQFCLGTPFEDVEKIIEVAFDNDDIFETDLIDDLREAVQDELDFLKSLRVPT